jgi:hypothetical protein
MTIKYSSVHAGRQRNSGIFGPQQDQLCFQTIMQINNVILDCYKLGDPLSI